MLGSPLLTPRSWRGKAGAALSLEGGPGLPGVPGEAPLLCHCSVPSRPPRELRVSRKASGKVHGRMRVGREIKSGVTFHSQSWEQHHTPALGSAPAPHRAGGAKGCPAILWLSPAHRHGINQVTRTHTGVDEGRSFSLLSAGSPDPPHTVSLLFCLGFASGMGGVWAEGRGIPSCHVGRHLKAVTALSLAFPCCPELPWGSQGFMRPPRTGFPSGL